LAKTGDKPTKAFFKTLASKEDAKQIKALKTMEGRITYQAYIEKEFVNHIKWLSKLKG
jgi:hypothetical protein